MSSILEALKKLEDEKTARRGGAGNIAGKVTAPGRRTRQRPAWLVPSGMTAVAVVAVIATYAVMGGFAPRQSVTVPVRRPAPVFPAPALPVPQAVFPDSMNGMATPTELPETVPPGSTSAPSPSSSATIPAPPQVVPAPKHTAPPPSSRREIPAEKAPPSLQEPAVDQLTIINVTGIAWQKDSASRLAVINGSPVAEGAMIEGARVKEILPDRVRFSANGTEFEVPLGK